MQSSALNQQPYGMSDPVIRSERSIEYQAFAKVTGLLAAPDLGDAANHAQLAEAVHQNRRLWNILAKDVLSDDNALPVDLRANIFSISQFIARHSALVLSGSADVSTLVDLNKTIMRGLNKG